MGLLDFLQKLPTENELKGSFGEWLTKHYSKIMTDALILHDVLIDGTDGRTSQLDLVMVGAKGIYVVEVKSFNGKVYGDGKKKTWYYYTGGKKYDIYSPLLQNKKHIQYLKTFLADFGDIPFFSVILLIGADFKVSNINRNPDNIDTVVCNSLPALTDAIQLLAKGKPTILDETKKQQAFNFIQNNQHIGNDARVAHKKSVQNYKVDLEMYKEQKMCPYCKTPLVLRKGKYGEFYGCRNYPKCKYTLK